MVSTLWTSLLLRIMIIASLIVLQVFIMYILFFDLFIIIAILFTVEMVRLSLNAFEVKFSFAELLAIKSNS